MASPIAVKLYEISVIPFVPICTVALTRLVPFTAIVPYIVEFPDTWPESVSVIDWPDELLVVVTLAALVMPAPNTPPPVALLETLKTTMSIWLDGTTNDKPENVYAPSTGVVLTARGSMLSVSLKVCAFSCVLLYNATETMSASVTVPVLVTVIDEMFICSPVAEKLNDIIVTLVEPITVVVATLLVPVMERLP